MKLNSTKKITRATLKSFIKNNIGALYVMRESAFNGMTDGVDYFPQSERVFLPAVQAYRTGEPRTEKPFKVIGQDNHDLGIDGVWLTGSTRGRGGDYFKFFEDEIYIGIEFFNCCGSGKIAIKKNQDAEPEPNQDASQDAASGPEPEPAPEQAPAPDDSTAATLDATPAKIEPATVPESEKSVSTRIDEIINPAANQAAEPETIPEPEPLPDFTPAENATRENLTG